MPEIAGQSIAPGGPLRVIAEIGLNHNGDAGLAHQLVEACADAGVFAIKLQVFDADQLLVADAPPPAHVDAVSLRDFFRRYELAPDVYAALVGHARRRQLAVIATAFDPSSLARLSALNIDAFKIASGDLTHVALIAAASRTGRPVILSTGMSEAPEVEAAIGVARGAGADTLAVLHCVSAYPTPDAEQNLRAIGTLARLLDVPVGLSDHGMGSDAALLAYAQGATLYERHVHLPGTGAIDAPVSSTPDDLAALVRRLARAHAAMGHGVRTPMPAELPNRMPSRRGLYARRALVAGERIGEADLVALRPAIGLGAEHLPALVGRTAGRDIGAGEPFDVSDLRPTPAEGTHDPA